MEDEKSLIRDLQSPVKSSRIAALQTIIAQGGSPGLLGVLERFPASEADDEMRLLLIHAVFSVRNKVLGALQSPPGEAEPSASPATFRQAFLQATPEGKLRYLSHVKGKRVTELASIAPELLSQETHPAVKGFLIRTFTKVWPENILSQFIDLLFADTIGIRMAALETLITRAPLILKDSLAPLLTSPDLRLRALAIQGLGKIDPEEAILHLESMLQDGDPACRIAALKTVFLMPFERCKNAILNYLSVESDSEQIKSVCLLFRLNPDPEVPFRLWEIAERSPREKAAAIKALINLSCKALEDAHILKEDMETFTNRLQNWIQQRVAVRYVQEFLSRYDPHDVPLQEELRQTFQKAVQKPLLKATFQDALALNYSDSQKAFLQSLLSETGPLVSAATPEPAAASETDDLERLRKISSLPLERKEEVKTVLSELFHRSTLEERLFTWAFRTALRFELPDFIQEAHNALKQTDVQIIEPAMEYLAWAQPDLTRSLIGTYLQHPHVRLKATALRLLKQHDISLTISTLLSMLKSKEASDRSAAISCIAVVDFGLLRDRLCTLVLEDTSGELLKPTICLFEANNDPANLYVLFRLEKELSEEGSQLAQTARQRCQAALVAQGRLLENALSTLETEFSIRYQKERARKAAPPSYAFAQKNKGSVFNDLLTTVSSLLKNDG